MIIVEDYNNEWKNAFIKIETYLRNEIPSEFEVLHIGSTSVEGLAAKPIIDLIIIADDADKKLINEKLLILGYSNRGDLGITGRDAFAPDKYVQDNFMEHHLYCGSRNNFHIKNLLYLSKFLKSSPEYVKKYSELKKMNSKLYPDDIDMYIEAKTELIIEMLELSGISKKDLDSIIEVNKAK